MGMCRRAMCRVCRMGMCRMDICPMVSVAMTHEDHGLIDASQHHRCWKRTDGHGPTIRNTIMAMHLSVQPLMLSCEAWLGAPRLILEPHAHRASGLGFLYFGLCKF